MSLFDKIFRPKKFAVDSYFKTLTAYQPVFRKWNGKLYEVAQVREALDATARHFSKMRVEIHGAAQPKLQTWLKKKPNQYQTWSQFLYRLSVILDMQNNVFIVPILSRDGRTINGLWTCLPSRCAVKELNGVEWLEYQFSTGDKGYVELSRCGLVTQHQYESDFFGSTNNALDETMDLATIQREGIKEAIKSASTFRFMARLTNFKDPDDIATEQRNFTARNLAADASGFLLFPNTYDSIQQITSKPYTISAEEQKLVDERIHNYFGVPEGVIKNTAAGSELDAFFDGKLEPRAIQLSEVLTFMLFTETEVAHGAKVEVTANRLQYMSTSDKINFISALSDRGMITINEGRELLNYTAIEGGDRLPIRGEYYFVGEDKTSLIEENPDKPVEDPEEGGNENGDKE